MAQFELIFVVDELVEETVWAIYERHEAAVAVHGSTTLLTMLCEGETAFRAAQHAVALVERIAGVRVQRLCEDLVSKVDIAERCGATLQAVGNWVHGARQYTKHFPEPFSLVCGGVWLWGEVNEWLRRTGKEVDSVHFPCRVDYAEINQWLGERNARRQLAESPTMLGGAKTEVTNVRLPEPAGRPSFDWSSAARGRVVEMAD